MVSLSIKGLFITNEMDLVIIRICSIKQAHKDANELVNAIRNVRR